MSTQVPLPNDYKPSDRLTTSTVDPKQWFSNFILVVKEFGFLPLENKDPKGIAVLANAVTHTVNIHEQAYRRAHEPVTDPSTDYVWKEQLLAWCTQEASTREAMLETWTAGVVLWLRSTVVDTILSLCSDPSTALFAFVKAHSANNMGSKNPITPFIKFSL
jgi:hypothetical protein